MLDSIHDKVKAGRPSRTPSPSHGALFPPVYSASLVAGERSGDLEAVIRRYVAYDKVLATVRGKTLSALIYPAILVAMMIVLVGIIVLRVVPAFSTFYGNFGRELPLSTRIIVGVSNFFVAQHLGHPGGRRRGGHRAGVVGPAARAAGTARSFAAAGCRGWARPPASSRRLKLARTLSTLLGGGIPLVKALDIGGRAMSNRFLASEMDEVRQRVQEGQGSRRRCRARACSPTWP